MDCSPGLKLASALVVLLMGCNFSSALSGGDSHAAMAAATASIDALMERAVVKPDHAGPYSVGYMYETIKPSTKSYSPTIKFFYPAQSAGQDAAVNSAGAPYPTVVQLTGFGGNVESMNGVATRMASWGLVIAEFEVNWDDWPNCANISDMNDLLDQLERDNASSSHRLSGMMDTLAFGIHGYSSGGGICLVDATYIKRFKAVASWASAIGNDYLDILAPDFTQPVQLQAGQNDATYKPNAAHAYQVFGPPKAFLEITGGTHQGPYAYDALISFFLRYLDGVAEYDHFLYGTGAMDDAANLNYSLKFTLPNGSFFPPNITMSASNTTVDEDGWVFFNCSYEGYLPVGHPKGNFNWDLNSDARVEVSGPYNTTAAWSYPQVAVPRASMWFQLGNLRLPANRTAGILVVNLPPNITAHGALSAVEDQTLHFTANASDTPSDIPSLAYKWDFGDGSQGNAQNASHYYKQAGNYTVKLNVKDDDGAEANDQFAVTVQNLPPTVAARPAVSALKDEEVRFTGSGNDTPSDIALLQYRWDFGDGAGTEWSTLPDATHTFTRSGNFTTNLSVRDDDGARGGARTNVTVSNSPPSASIRLPQDRATFNKDEQVRFTGAGADTPSDARTLTFSWDFGDGNRSDWTPLAETVHTYTKGGKYLATLWARDPEMALASSTVNIVIENAAPTVRLLSPVAATFNEDEKVRFAAEADDTESDRPLLAYSWEIDGKGYVGQTVELAFTDEGTHGFKVTVTDPEGATDSASGTVNIRNPAPKLAASFAPARIVESGTVNFTAAVNDTPSDRPVLEVVWDFGDGNTSRGLSVSHVFARPGSYNGKVTVSDDENGRAEQAFTILVDAKQVTPPPPPPATPSSSSNSLPLAIGAFAAVLAMGALMALLARRRAKKAP